MPHPADDGDENNPPFSSPCSAPPIEEIAPPEPQPIAAPQPANENLTPPVVTKLERLEEPQTFDKPKAFEKSFDPQAEDSLRMAITGSTAHVPDVYGAANEAYETTALAMRVSAEQFAAGMAALNWKLLEFGRANAQVHLNYAQGVASARSMRDLVDLQASYVRGQCDALTGQLRELRVLSTEIAGKTAAPFKDQFARAAQLGRMG